MSTPANVIAFWSETHWGSGYGVVDQFHPTPHKGLDAGLFHGIVDVPAAFAGAVVAVGPSTTVGHYVTVKRPDSWFDTYCHIVPGVKVGDKITIGARLGRQATTQAEGGTAWKGQHTHLCKSRTLSGWAVWGYVNVDPTPDLIAVLTNAASSGETALDTSEDDMAKPEFLAWNNIYWPNGELYGYTEAIYNSVKYFYDNGGIEQPGTEGTIAREITLNLERQAARVAAHVTAGPGAAPIDMAALAAQVATTVDAALADNFAAVAAQVAALDTQSDTYNAQLEAILAKGLTLTGIAVPSK